MLAKAALHLELKSLAKLSTKKVQKEDVTDTAKQTKGAKQTTDKTKKLPPTGESQ